MDSRRVLVVDDDPMIVRALCRILESAGFAPEGAHDPEEALVALRREKEMLVFSDYMMPGLHGVHFLQEARKLCPDAPRLLLTAVNDFKVAIDAVNNGEIYRLLQKPWNAAELVSTVKQAWEWGELRRKNEELSALVHRQNAELKEVNRDLERKVQERTNGLLEGMIAALDFRDTETQWHSRRVAMFARRLAEALGLVGQELFDIEVGALLHDIGKIGVRDSVLLKPGPLTPEEWVEMKEHPAIGWRLLRRIEYLDQASKIVLQHQERWDGKGYPAALAGDAIVIGARIFAVVDTLDAILSDRPYRKGRPFEVALAEIQRCSGTQFDPKVVDAFVAVPKADWDGIRARVEELAAEEKRRVEQDGLGQVGRVGQRELEKAQTAAPKPAEAKA